MPVFDVHIHIHPLAMVKPAVGAAILPFSHFLLPKQAALWKASA